MTPLQDQSIAERHRAVAGRFTELVAAVPDWDARSPVPDWRARDVVAHLTSWFPAFLEAGAGITLPAAGDDPVTGWAAQTEAIQSVLDSPAAAGQPFTNRHMPGLTVAEAIDQFYTSDVFLHSWDLARASGQPDHLDPDYCALLLAGMRPAEQAMRSSGHYGPAFPVPSDADPQTQVLAFIGRDPGWSPA